MRRCNVARRSGRSPGTDGGSAKCPSKAVNRRAVGPAAGAGGSEAPPIARLLRLSGQAVNIGVPNIALPVAFCSLQALTCTGYASCRSGRVRC